MMDERILSVLRGVDDPEVGVNIVDLGLVYGAVRGEDAIEVALTMTSRSCPLGEQIVEEAHILLSDAFPGVADISIRLVWSPAWGPERMSDEARRQLFVE
jgi:metal-sulfur cluster biosynthetic enzyme